MSVISVNTSLLNTEDKKRKHSEIVSSLNINNEAIVRASLKFNSKVIEDGILKYLQKGESFDIGATTNEKERFDFARYFLPFKETLFTDLLYMEEYITIITAIMDFYLLKIRLNQYIHREEYSRFVRAYNFTKHRQYTDVQRKTNDKIINDYLINNSRRGLVEHAT